MRVRGAIAIVVLVAALVTGGGGGSSSTRAAKHRGVGREEVGFLEEGGLEEEEEGIVEVEGAGLQEAEMVAGEAGWVRSEDGVFWPPDGGRTWRPITPPVPHGFAIAGVYFANPRRGWALSDT